MLVSEISEVYEDKKRQTEATCNKIHLGININLKTRYISKPKLPSPLDYSFNRVNRVLEYQYNNQRDI